VVKAGSTEIWHLENTSMMAHPLHIHFKETKVSKQNYTEDEKKCGDAGDRGLLKEMI
jgi:FtsP/CotA-like multicopper oxidase with cupredoxin domain